MQDLDTPPEVEEAETDVGGDVVRLVVVAVPDSTVDVVVATDSNRTGSSPLPWTITTATMGMVPDPAAGDAVVLVLPTCSLIPSRCRKPAKTLLQKYSPLSTICSSWPRFRKRPAR